MASYKHVHIRSDFPPSPEAMSWRRNMSSSVLNLCLKPIRKILVLTYLVVHLKCDVKLQDDQHELEPGAHLLVRQRNVDSKYDVVGLDLLGHGFVKGPEFGTLVRTPGHKPFCFLLVLACIHTLGGQVVDCGGGAGSW